MRKKILATGVALTILLTGSNTALAQNNTVQTSNKAPSRMTIVASKLGLDVDEIKDELQEGKTFKEILEENDISLKEARKVLGNGKWPSLKHTKKGIAK